MSARLDAIDSWLVAHGVAGGSTGWAIHKLAAQDAPDKAVTIYPTGGPAPEQATDRSWPTLTYQIVARSKVQAEAADKVLAIFDTLDRADLPGFNYFLVMHSSPIGLGPDVNGRYRFSLNFRGGAS